MNAPYDAERIARDEAICVAAAPGPWTVDEGEPPDGQPFRHVEGWRDHGEDYMWLYRADAEFIAAARQGWPDALAALRARDAEIERLRAALLDIIGSTGPAQADPWPWLELIEQTCKRALKGGQP